MTEEIRSAENERGKFDQNVWKMIEEIGTAERHFNSLQHEYRKIASTWLLAYIGGIGFIFSTGKHDLPFDLGVWTMALSFAAGFGLALIWLLDNRVYHKLLLANYVSGVILEVEHRWLPETRLRNYGVAARFNAGLFYCGGLLICLLGFQLGYQVAGDSLHFVEFHEGFYVEFDTVYQFGMAALLTFLVLILNFCWWDDEIARLSKKNLN